MSDTNPHTDWPLEPGPEALRALIQAATDRIVPYIESLDDQPAAYISLEEAAAVARSLADATMPEAPLPTDQVLSVLFDRAVPASFNAAGPGYLAYVPGGGVVHSAVGEFIAACINRFTGVWVAAPALIQLETNVIRWLCDTVGYGEGALGFLTTGGSLANFSAVVCARTERLGDDFSHGVVYVSDQAHYSCLKAARLAGVPARNIVAIASDETFRMRADALAARIQADRNAGLKPMMVMASAGTTNTGAVDPLEAIADLTEAEGLWLHVDAAYGGFFVLTRRGRNALRGMERADSITLDPHKGLFLPYGTGALLVKDGPALARAHEGTAEYMPAMQSDMERLDFCRLTPELSRDYRGLRVWLPLQLCGVAAFRDALDEKFDLIDAVAAHLDGLDSVEIVAAPQLTVLAFRVADDDAVTRTVLERINARRRVMLTPTTLNNRFVIRVCILCFRTHADRVVMCLEDIDAALAEVLGLA